jgi:hypothetical protein
LSDTFPWTPHTATWQPRKDGLRGGNANDGPEDSEVEQAQIACFLEPKTSNWVAERYGTSVDRQPYLFVGTKADFEPIQKGDLILWDGKTLYVEQKPQIHDYGDGYVHGETYVTDQTTGGRS